MSLQLEEMSVFRTLIAMLILRKWANRALSDLVVDPMLVQVQLSQIGDRLCQLINDEKSLQNELSSNATKRQDNSVQLDTAQVLPVLFVMLRLTNGVLQAELMVDIGAAEAHLEQLHESKQALCVEQEIACQDIRQEQNVLQQNLYQCREEAMELQRQLQQKLDDAAGIQKEISKLDEQCQDRSAPMQEKIEQIESEQSAKTNQMQQLQEAHEKISVEQELSMLEGVQEGGRASHGKFLLIALQEALEAVENMKQNLANQAEQTAMLSPGSRSCAFSWKSKVAELERTLQSRLESIDDDEKQWGKDLDQIHKQLEHHQTEADALKAELDQINEGIPKLEEQKKQAVAAKDFKGATRLSQEVKSLIQLRDLNSNKLDEMMRTAFLKQREASTIEKELARFREEMVNEKEKVSEEVHAEIQEVLKEAAVHDSEAAKLIASTSGSDALEIPELATSSADADLLTCTEPEATAVNFDTGLDSLLSEPMLSASKQKTNPIDASDDLMDLLGAPSNPTIDPTVKPNQPQQAADLLLIPDVFTDSSPRVIEDDELLRHLSAQDNNDVFL